MDDKKFTRIDGVNWVEREIPTAGGNLRVPGLTVRALRKALESCDPDDMVTYMAEVPQPAPPLLLGVVGGIASGSDIGVVFIVGTEVTSALKAQGFTAKEEPQADIAPVPPVDRSAKATTDGTPYDPSNPNGETRPSGQHERYVVLSEEERKRGFVRPYRDAYRHVGMRPKYEVRYLNAEERLANSGPGYVAYEAYPDGSPERANGSTGRYWTLEQLNSGCGKITTMAREIAETYARDPGFYNATFCSTCKKHLSVGEKGEFTWYEMDGSEGPRVGT